MNTHKGRDDAINVAQLVGEVSLDGLRLDDLLQEPARKTADPERDPAQQLTALQAAFRERARAEAERLRNATDSEYWFAVCFQTREQKEAFLRALDLFGHGDKYLDGAVVARRLGVDLPDVKLRHNPGRGDPKAAKLVG